ncbi:MAG: hypothetical protein MUF24_14505 [Chitinophagaceae bacterium]|nr:hypothetical protein [Chitinophagaceae bacterium]
MINADGGKVLELLVFLAIEGKNGDITEEFFGNMIIDKKGMLLVEL